MSRLTMHDPITWDGDHLGCGICVIFIRGRDILLLLHCKIITYNVCRIWIMTLLLRISLHNYQDQKKKFAWDNHQNIIYNWGVRLLLLLLLSHDLLSCSCLVMARGYVCLMWMQKKKRRRRRKRIRTDTTLGSPCNCFVQYLILTNYYHHLCTE